MRCTGWCNTSSHIFRARDIGRTFALGKNASCYVSHDNRFTRGRCKQLPRRSNEPFGVVASLSIIAGTPLLYGIKTDIRFYIIRKGWASSAGRAVSNWDCPALSTSRYTTLTILIHLGSEEGEWYRFSTKNRCPSRVLHLEAAKYSCP